MAPCGCELSPHERSRHEPPVARRSARGVSGLLCDNPGGHTPLTGIAGRLVLLSSAGDPRSVSRIIAAWASARRSTSRARTRPPLPAPRLMTLIRRPLQQGRDDGEYSPIEGFVKRRLRPQFSPGHCHRPRSQGIAPLCNETTAARRRIPFSRTSVKSQTRDPARRTRTTRPQAGRHAALSRYATRRVARKAHRERRRRSVLRPSRNGRTKPTRRPRRVCERATCRDVIARLSARNDARLRRNPGSPL